MQKYHWCFQNLSGYVCCNNFLLIPDSDYSLKAQRVMQSAMKLPPHILPTLDELDPKISGLNTVRDDNVGVYGR